MSILFLFGAGASRGSEKAGISTPALGLNLFQVLRDYAPLTWGKLDREYGKYFQKDFEEGMNKVLAQHPYDVSELQRDMAKYFFGFSPSSENLYVRIIERIGVEGISFASLNYDKLLEEAILRSNFSPTYGWEPINERKVDFCLPHGCCNLFLKGLDIPVGALSFPFASNMIDSSEIKIIRSAKELHDELEQALPPVMSCFNSKKTSAVGKSFLELQQERFEKMVHSASLVVIIGVQVREHDKHIWEPLSMTKAKLVYCSGRGSSDFCVWHNKYRLNSPFHIFPKYFVDHFDTICDMVGGALEVSSLAGGSCETELM